MRSIEDRLRFQRENSFRRRELRNLNPIRPLLNNSCFFKAKTDFTYDRHTHDSYELVSSELLPYECLLNAERVRMPASHFLLVQPGDVHQGVLKSGQRLFVLSFDVETDASFGEKPTLFLKGRPGQERVVDPARISGVMEIYRVLYSLSRVDSPRSYYVLDGLFQSLFWALLPAWPDSLLNPFFAKESFQESFRGNLLDAFAKSIYGSTSVKALAARLRMTPRSLERKCRAILGRSPKTAFFDFKLRQIEKHVARSDLSMKEIGEMYGFKNQFHFSRLFKKSFGLSPAKYRKRERG